MPTISKQPSSAALPQAYVSAWGECATVCLTLTGDINVANGDRGQIQITITSANITTGTTFVVADQQFQVSSVDPQPPGTVNWTAGTALQKAQRLKMMLEVNPYISENFTIGEPVLVTSNYVLTIQAKRRNTISVTTTVPSPYSVTAIPGAADVVRYDQIAYRVYVASALINGPGFDVLDPTFSANLTANQLCFEVNHLVRPFLQTTFPLTPTAKTNPYSDLTIRRQVRVEMYGIKLDGCQKTSTTDLLTTNNFWMLNSAVQEEDRLFLSGLYPTTVYQTRRPLTRRTSFCSAPGSNDWLWLIADDRAQFAATGTLTYVLTMDTTGVYGSPTTIATLTSFSNVIVLPSGYGNTTTLSATQNVRRYKLQVLIDGNNVMEVEYSVAKSCGDIELYSLNDFGGYDTTRWELEEMPVNLENDVQCVATPCYNLSGVEVNNYANRLSLGGSVLLKSELTRAYKLTALESVSPDIEEEWMMFEQFLKSPIHYIKYIKSSQDLQRNVFIEPGSWRTVEREDGTQTVEIIMYAHKPQNVQI
jgi:hypothetical protein